VRALIGHDWCTSRMAHAQLARMYRLIRLHANFFQFLRRLVHQMRPGARATEPRSCPDPLPAAVRLWGSVPREAAGQSLRLPREIDAALTQLWRPRGSRTGFLHPCASHADVRR
jgi:hypothetical protein